MIAINVGSIMLWFFVNSLMIIHLGMKPDNGGKPPSDNIVAKIRTDISGILFHSIERDNVVVVELYCNSKNVVRVIIIYSNKFSIVIDGLYVRIAVIQPMCAIEEYAMIFRSWVWFRPPHPPIAIDRVAAINIMLVSIVWAICIRIDRGANFCQVSRIMPDVSETPCVTSGTQKWKGAIPNFIIMADVIIMDVVELDIFITDHCPEYIRLIIMASISSIEAVAWVKKYFVAASIDRGLKFFIRMGITANIFISNPIHTISQWELIITITVPIIIVKQIVHITIGFISTGRI